ncbi:small integral membrane protein 34 [Peromyscus californicus insignis]|uniref:small integral membrane protein 34 n=1 Tax=Peromyscus californicus insignis TaxID=564181 RepID=UPI0022A6D4D1|nr:small integral membrane protein 34 [Peromyscus californicus insignis]
MMLYSKPCVLNCWFLRVAYMLVGSHLLHTESLRKLSRVLTPPWFWIWACTLSPGHLVSSGPFCFPVIKWKPQEAFNQTQSSSLLHDPVEGRDSTNCTRTLRLPDATSAAWYILTIIGIYGVIFVFQLASNILRKSERSLEDICYSNLTSELKREGFQSKVAACSLVISNAAALQPQQDGLDPRREEDRLHRGTQGVP